MRARYAEDRLWEAITAGVGQYVIPGAGPDTFALRSRGRANRLSIYEVDHPASQEMERRQLERIAGGVPSNRNLVPVDFETDRLDEALAAAGFNRDASAFFSWQSDVLPDQGNDRRHDSARLRPSQLLEKQVGAAVGWKRGCPVDEAAACRRPLPNCTITRPVRRESPPGWSARLVTPPPQ